MLRWKTICWASFTTACMRKTPEKFLGLASAYAERQIMHHFAEGLYPDSGIYLFADKCLRKNPINDSQLENYLNSKLLTLKTISNPSFRDSIKSHLTNIDTSISKMLKIDIKATDIVTKFFDFYGTKHMHASAMLLMAQAMSGISMKQLLFTQSIEMAHFGSSIHNKILDNSSEASWLHMFLGDNGMILGGDYMISNASIECCRINSLPMIQLLCLIIQNIAKGSILSLKGENISEVLMNYCALCFYKTASIMANGCQGIAYLAGSDIKRSYDYGKHLGMALSVASDIKDYLNGKLKYSSFPVLFAANTHQNIQKLIEEKQESLAKELIADANGINWAKKLAIHHIEAAIEAANQFESPKELVALAASISNSL